MVLASGSPRLPRGGADGLIPSPLPGPSELVAEDVAFSSFLVTGKDLTGQPKKWLVNHGSLPNGPNCNHPPERTETTWVVRGYDYDEYYDYC